MKSGPATLQQAFEVRTIENALNKVTDQRATRGPAVLVSEVFESCEQLAVYNERDQRLSRLESVVGTHRRCPDSEDCFLHRVVALPTVATLVDDLEVVDIVASAARPGNDVIDVQIFWIERPKAQAADASRLLPEHGQQSTNGRHSSDLTRADLLEDVDDLTIERAVLALGELGQPTMQIGVQPA